MKFKCQKCPLSKNDTHIRNGLSPFVPEKSLNDLCLLLNKYPFTLRITRRRQTKLGDFRPNLKGGSHNISVNGNLNKFAFLITLLHEISHLKVWDKWGPKAKPHGTEWKTEFKVLLQAYVEKSVFPSDIYDALLEYLKNPKASSCSDLGLQRTLRKYDEQVGLTVEEIPFGEEFLFRGNKYRKIKKRRTRFECENLTTKKVFLFYAMAEVDHVVRS